MIIFSRIVVIMGCRLFSIVSNCFSNDLSCRCVVCFVAIVIALDTAQEEAVVDIALDTAQEEDVVDIAVDTAAQEETVVVDHYVLSVSIFYKNNKD